MAAFIIIPSPPMNKPAESFTAYQKFIIAILSVLQFSVVLDFMVLSPLGAILLDELDIQTSQFGLVVSAYAISAGLSGILAAGFADRFDRKKFLLFFYTGFIAGTLFCGLAPDYPSLLIARIITGIFGGVIGSTSLAIITDLFQMQQRGRVMGFVQMAFAASQVLGIPVGLFLANKFEWHAPFLMIVIFSIFIAIAISVYMKPVAKHVAGRFKGNPLDHLLSVVKTPRYVRAFAATTLLATGGFMLMPFASAYLTDNVGLSNDQLPGLYAITGIFTMVAGPLVGRFSDKTGKYRIFLLGSLLTIVMVIIYTNLGITPLWLVIAINVLLFIGVTSRMITASAMITGIPDPADRGAFMSINSSIQQLAGGVASGLAGIIVFRSPAGHIENYAYLGWVVTGSLIITALLFRRISRQIIREGSESGL
jgi:predicted MFS family arabinose efflux permease